MTWWTIWNLYFRWINERRNPADTDVFKMSSGLLKRSRRHATKPDVAKTSCKRLLIYVVLKTSNLWRLEDVWFTTSWRRLIYVSSCGHLIYDVLKTSDLRRFKDVRFTTSWSCLIYVVLKTSDLWRLEDVRFTTSWKRLIYDVLKMFDLRRLEDVCKAKQRRSDVYTTLKEMIFYYHIQKVLSCSV